VISSKKLENLIARCLNDFYAHRLAKIKSINIRNILARKNPYLFRAIATEQASEIVGVILSSFLSSSDETIFGNDFFEPIAREVSGGHAAEAGGVDVVVEKSDTVIAYAIKSGPNPQNKSATDKQALEFNELRSRLLKLRKQFDPVLAAGYGRKCRPATAKRAFRMVSGQAFWAELTGDRNFYIKLIRLMKDIPAAHKEAYKPEWDAAVNRLTAEFIADFCYPDGRVNWEQLTEFVSSDGLG
jgi:hypothetical protein